MNLFCRTAVVGVLGSSLSLEAQQLLHRFEDPSVTFALNVANGGDKTLDGVPEILVSRGNEVVVFDGATGVELHSTVIPFGTWTMARAGDVDGDGREDTLVGQGAFNRVRVVSGADGSVLQLIQGPAGGHFGAAVSAVGDVNGDGRDDFLVGAPWEDSPENEKAGAVRVYSGADFSALSVRRGLDKNDYFGIYASGIGDADGDLLPDFAASGLRPWRVEVLSGSGAPLSTFADPGLTGYLQVDEVGDVDGDGLADVVTASNSKVWVFRGVDGLGISSQLGAGPGFAVSLAGVGDVDGDGFGDFAVGNGDLRADVEVYCGRTMARLLHFPEKAGDPGSGPVVDGLGDLDGDGKSELLLGIPAAYKALVVSGQYWDSIGVPFGFGDGSGGACPCGATSGTGLGCPNSKTSGAYLRAFGSSSVSAFPLAPAKTPITFTAGGLAGAAQALLFVGTTKKNGGAGVPLGAGLKVVGSPVQRLFPQTAAGPDGLSTFERNYAQIGGWVGGETLYFQVWYRDSQGPCKTTNLTHGLEVTFTP
jgi:hypothetical protein